MPLRKPRGNVGIVNWLLNNPEVTEFISAKTPRGATPNIVLASFDEASEFLCAERGYRLLMPPYSLRNHIDSKVTTTEIGNECGLDSAPNIITTIADYTDLVSQARDAGLGDDLVIQLPMGDSGSTTFFVSDPSSFDTASARIAPPPRLP
jgi:biotin carboxylase